MEDNAGLAGVGGPVGPDHGVPGADGVTGPHKHVKDVHAPGPACPHDQLVDGVAALLEGDNDTDAVGELGPPGGDHPRVQAVHDGALEDCHAHPLGDHHGDQIGELGAEEILWEVTLNSELLK